MRFWRSANLHGIENFSHDVTKEEREKMPDVPQSWYVIEQAHIDGIVIWQSGDGDIYQTIPGYNPQKIADSLAEYIDM